MTGLAGPGKSLYRLRSEKILPGLLLDGARYPHKKSYAPGNTSDEVKDSTTCLLDRSTSAF